jgi:hypothetical protein
MGARFTRAPKSVNPVTSDSEACPHLGEPSGPVFGSRYAVPIGEIREAQSRTKRPSAAAQGRAGDPGIDSGTHQGRQLAWTFQNGSENGNGVSRAVGTQPNRCGCRQWCICRINDDASGSEGNLMSAGDCGRNVRFHVDRNCARLRVEQLLALRIEDQIVHAENICLHGPRKPLSQGACPRLIGRKKSLSGYNRGRGDPIARGQPGRQSSGDPKADDSASAALNRGLKSSSESLTLAADNGYAGTYGDIRLECKGSNGDNAPRHRGVLVPRCGYVPHAAANVNVQPSRRARSAPAPRRSLNAAHPVTPSPSYAHNSRGTDELAISFLCCLGALSWRELAASGDSQHSLIQILAGSFAPDDRVPMPPFVYSFE